MLLAAFMQQTCIVRSADYVLPDVSVPPFGFRLNSS